MSNFLSEASLNKTVINRRTRHIPCCNCSHILHPCHDLAPKSADLVVGMRRQHKLHALHSCPLSWQGVLVLFLLAFAWWEQHKQGALINQISNGAAAWPSAVLCLLHIPSWAVLLLSRSVMISAWMSLILLRSAARLYSICSICVRGITCFSCTWTQSIHTTSGCHSLCFCVCVMWFSL